MDLLFDMVLMWGIVSVFFLPLVVLTALMENTKIGVRLSDWLLEKMGAEVSEDESM